MTSEQKQGLLTMPTAILLVGLLVAGVLYINENGFNLPSGNNRAKGTGVANNNTNSGTGVSANDSVPTSGEVAPVSDQDHVRGDRNATIALIEYSDYECPFCKQFHATAQRALDEYDGQLMWVYRHYPIAGLHSKAPKEAEAGECANKLGGEEAFWQFTDKIFEVTPSNNGLDASELPKIAAEIGLDKDKFQQCLDSGEFADLVQAQIDSGSQAGVTGTPSNFLLNTKTGETRLVPGAVPFATLKQAIDAIL